MVIQLLFLALLTLALAILSVAETIVLDGRDFWSTSVTVGGEEKTLVPGSRLKIRFHDDGRVSASAGCNSMQGDTYSVDEGGILTIGDMSMTEMGCEEGFHEQDNFLAELLRSQPTVVLEENKLVLSTDAVTIDFLDRKIADPDRPLVGTDWLENGFFSKVIVSKWCVDKAGWIKFSADEKISFFDGCAEGELTYSNAPYDELINFEVAEGRVTCADSLDNIDAYAAEFNKIFDTKSVRYEIIGPHLKLSNENGDGVSFTAGTIVDSSFDSSAGTAPTNAPSTTPSTSPTHKPSASPSKAPSTSPTIPLPTRSPSKSPSKSPSSAPTGAPSKSPTDSQISAPSTTPSTSPKDKTSASPSKAPSTSPTTPLPTIVDSFSDSSAGARNQCLGTRAPFSVMMAALLFTLAKYQ